MAKGETAAEKSRVWKKKPSDAITFCGTDTNGVYSVLGWVCNCFRPKTILLLDHTTGQSTKTQVVEARNGNFVRKSQQSRPERRWWTCVLKIHPASTAFRPLLYEEKRESSWFWAASGGGVLLIISSFLQLF